MLRYDIITSRVRSLHERITRRCLYKRRSLLVFYDYDVLNDMEVLMKKKAVVINGAGGVGKDTLCELASKHFKVRNISSITPIKEIAAMCGWDGTKDNKARKFLSDLKRICVEYNDYPTEWAKRQYNDFVTSDDDVMFVHIREPEEIKKFVDKTGGEAVTLLVRGGKRMSNEKYGNASDDGVENYSYDYYFLNENTLEVAEAEFVALVGEILSK